MSTSPRIQASPDGALVRVRVSAGAARARIAGLHGDALKLAVREPPERGKANRGVARLLADALGLAPSRVTVARGETSRDKTVLFRGLDAAEARRRIASILVILGDP